MWYRQCKILHWEVVRMDGWVRTFPQEKEVQAQCETLGFNHDCSMTQTISSNVKKVLILTQTMMFLLTYPNYCGASTVILS